NVRDFVGHQDVGLVQIDLNNLLNRSVSLIESRTRKMSIEKHLATHTPMPTVRGDAVQIEQVLVNIINNALDAMEVAEPDQRKLWLTSEGCGSSHVQVMVADSGPGIAAETISDIFDAFYTTKQDGMGMGMSICKTIVDEHGGQLWAESERGRGTTFYLRLPACTGDTDNA